MTAWVGAVPTADQLKPDLVNTHSGGDQCDHSCCHLSERTAKKMHVPATSARLESCIALVRI